MGRDTYPLSALLCVAGEKSPGNGEDSYYFDSDGEDYIVSVFDGLGGSGARKYLNYSQKSGAYIGARAACGSVRSWFAESRKPEQLKQYIAEAMMICKRYEDPPGRLVSSMSASFPTTAAIAVGNGETLTVFWAGDSRCYLLDANGLHQLTQDDVHGQDAMENLTADSGMTNLIRADALFELHQRTLQLKQPGIVFSATDGCYDYLCSPMAFEGLLLETLSGASGLTQWEHALNAAIKEVTGDDYSLCAAVCGYDDFVTLKEIFQPRHSQLVKQYLREGIPPQELWKTYRMGYEFY